MTNTQATPRRDGLSINTTLVTMHQKMGKGDINIPTDAITGGANEDKLALPSGGAS